MHELRDPPAVLFKSEKILGGKIHEMPCLLELVQDGELARRISAVGAGAKDAPQGGGRSNRHPLMQRLLDNSLLLPKALTNAGYLTFQTGKLWNATYKDVGFTHGMTAAQGRHGGDGLAIGREGMQPIGGIRTPMFVRWPDKVKALRDDDTLASIIDIAPTILNMAGAPVPNDLTGLDLTDRQAMANRKSVLVEAYTHTTLPTSSNHCSASPRGL